MSDSKVMDDFLSTDELIDIEDIVDDEPKEMEELQESEGTDVREEETDSTETKVDLPEPIIESSQEETSVQDDLEEFKELSETTNEEVDLPSDLDMEELKDDDPLEEMIDEEPEEESEEEDLEEELIEEEPEEETSVYEEEVAEEESEESEEPDEVEEETEEETEEEPVETEISEDEPSEHEFAGDPNELDNLLAFNSEYEEKVIPLEDIEVVKEDPFFSRQSDANITPVVFKDSQGKYQLIAGGYLTCRVVEADETVEELYRCDYRLKNSKLAEGEEGILLSKEIDIYSKGYDMSFDKAIDMVADLNGTDSEYVKRLVLVQRLTPELKQKLEKGITSKQAEILLDLNKTQQKTVATVIDKLGLNVITTQEALELKALAEKKELTEANARVALDHDSVFIKKSELDDIIKRLTTSVIREIEERGAISVNN